MNTLKASAVVVDITPMFVNRTYLAGFMPDRVATGVSEPLTARILFMEDANGPMVWISVDSIGLMLHDTDLLKSKIKGIAPERILICSTHSHSTPDTMGMWGPAINGVPYKSGRDPEYINWMLQEISRGVERAEIRKKPAVIGWKEDNTDKSEWAVNVRSQNEQDHSMSVLRIDETDSRPIAVLTNWACHPETLWENNKKISPDFVHYFNKRVEEETGAVSLFINGALGGMVTPNLDPATNLTKRRSFLKRFGKAMGDIALETREKISPITVGEIEHRYNRLQIPFHNKQLVFLSNLGLLQRNVLHGKMETVLHTFRIGDAQFASLPGEPLPAVGLAAKDLLGGNAKFLFGLADDELGYLLNYLQEADPKYAYELSVSIGAEGTQALLDGLKMMTFK